MLHRSNNGSDARSITSQRRHQALPSCRQKHQRFCCVPCSIFQSSLVPKKKFGCPSLRTVTPFRVANPSGVHGAHYAFPTSAWWMYKFRSSRMSLRSSELCAVSPAVAGLSFSRYAGRWRQSRFSGRVDVPPTIALSYKKRPKSRGAPGAVGKTATAGNGNALGQPISVR